MWPSCSQAQLQPQLHTPQRKFISVCIRTSQGGCSQRLTWLSQEWMGELLASFQYTSLLQTQKPSASLTLASSTECPPFHSNST